jgi:tetratricopeptide (TPR) repeat protein
MEASIASIASSPIAKEAKVDASVHSVLLWLSECQRVWLLVFDGADVDYDVVERFFPPGAGGNILISTRIRDMTRLSRPSYAGMEVIEMREEAAIELLFRSAKLQSDIASESTKAQARKIVDTLCYLPLAIDQAGSFIADSVYSINDYLRLYEKQPTRIAMFDNSRFQGSSKYERAVYSTWDITIDELERRSQCNTPNALSYRIALFLLRIFSFFHFDVLDEHIFRRAAENGPLNSPTEEEEEEIGTRIAAFISRGLRLRNRGKQPDGVLDRRKIESAEILELQDFCLALDADGAWDPFYFREGISLLLRFSLVKKSTNGTAYAMHRLVHQWCQDRTPEDAFHSSVWASAVAIMTRSICNDSGGGDYLYLMAVYTHIIALLRTHSNDGFLLSEANALFPVFLVTEDFVSAEALLTTSFNQYFLKSRYEFTREYSYTLSDVDPRLSMNKKFTSSAFFIKNQTGDSESMNPWAVIVKECQLTAYLEQLGEAYERDNIYNQIWCRMGTLGVENDEVIQLLARLAHCFVCQARYKEAESLQWKILECRARFLAPNNMETLWAMYNLSGTLMFLGRLKEANSLSRCALHWCTDNWGLDHEDTITMMERVAWSLAELGKYREAENLERQVLDWRITSLGQSHLNTARAMELLASVLLELRRYEEAENIQRELLEWRKAAIGPHHVSTIGAKATLGAIMREKGDVVGAVKLNREALDESTQRLQVGQYWVTQMYVQELYAESLLHTGRCKEAESLLRSVYVWGNDLGHAYPRTVLIIAKLARALRELGRYDDAESYCAEALSKGIRVLGTEHPRTLEVMEEFAKTLKGQGRFEEALMMDYQRMELETARGY